MRAVNTPIYHAVKIGTLPEKKKESQKQEDKQFNIKRFVRTYLCAREFSRCVVLRTCECLDVCQYGRKYIEATKGGGNHE